MSLGRTATLNTGHKMPTLGYGTWQSKPGEVGDGVFEALKAGYRHLDLAVIYGNQPEVAQGIKRAIAEVPGLKREDIFITSKLWNNSHRPQDVAAALDQSLAQLELEYLDLYLIHWPVAFQPGSALSPKHEGTVEAILDEEVSLSDTWKAMTELPKTKVRSVGVSNFTIEHLETVIKDTGVTPAMNQIERHPRLPGKEMVAFCSKHGILTTAYSAFGNNNWGLPLLVAEPDVKAIADRLSEAQGKPVTTAQVILAWAQRDGQIVIPKSVTASRIRENFQEVDIDDDAVAALDKIGEKPIRLNIPTTYKNPRWDINIWNEEKEQGAKHKVILKV